MQAHRARPAIGVRRYGAPALAEPLYAGRSALGLSASVFDRRCGRVDGIPTGVLRVVEELDESRRAVHERARASTAARSASSAAWSERSTSSAVCAALMWLRPRLSGTSKTPRAISSRR
jgi:hypothetical protein